MLLMNNPLPTEILIATHNAGKLREFQNLLSGFPFALRSLRDFPHVAEVIESGSSFAENAVLKARDYSKQTGLWTLADDSGLEVEALGGAPGIFSARYGGEGATDAERMSKLLSELSRTNDATRRARFVCVIALTDAASAQVKTFTGTCEGRIAEEPRGSGGFGYDPIFIPDGYAESFGELPPAIKQLISHRARALKAARAFLLDGFPRLA
jgi:XTP/dITP diphosphohydrolase